VLETLNQFRSYPLNLLNAFNVLPQVRKPNRNAVLQMWTDETVVKQSKILIVTLLVMYQYAVL